MTRNKVIKNELEQKIQKWAEEKKGQERSSDGLEQKIEEIKKEFVVKNFQAKRKCD